MKGLRTAESSAWDYCREKQVRNPPSARATDAIGYFTLLGFHSQQRGLHLPPPIPTFNVLLGGRDLRLGRAHRDSKRGRECVRGLQVEVDLIECK